MRRAARGLAIEVIGVGLVLASVAGSWCAVVAMHRRQAATRRAPSVVVAPPPPSPTPPAPKPRPRPIVEPVPPPEDPTPRVLARLAELEAEQRRAAEELSRANEERTARIASTRARAREARERANAIRARLEQLDQKVRELASSRDVLARHRDVLARTKDDARIELAQARSHDGFAVLPYKGPNGTWRRPIAIECRDGMATLQPGGPSFSLVEMSALGPFRSNPLVGAVRRYLAHAELGRSPDGAPVVPYILFVIRPDGIRPYYEARGILEPVGLSFGYELVEQDAELDFPDLDDPAEWTDAAPPPRFARGGWPPADPAGAARNLAAGADDPYIWPTTPPGGGPGGGDRAAEGEPEGRESGGMTGLAGRGLFDPEGLDASGQPALPHGHPVGTDAAGRGSSSGGMLPGDGRLDLSAGNGKPMGEGRAPARADLPPRSATGWPGTASAADVVRRMDGGAGERPTMGTNNPGEPGRQGRGSPPSASGGSGLAREESRGAAGRGVAGGGGGGAAGPVDGSTFRMERPLELVVACGPGGVTIQPGGYRLTAGSLEPGDGRLVEMLRGVVRRRELREPPTVELAPRLTFVVQPGGQETYWKARRQTILAGLGWPIRLRVAEGDVAVGTMAEGPLR